MVVSAILAMAILGGQAVPESGPPSSPAQSVDPPVTLSEVEVTGPSRRAIQSFVDVAVDPGQRGPNQGQIATWRKPLCVRVIGGPYEDNVRLTDAIKAVYVSLDRPVGSDRCQPNVMVVVTENATGFARLFVNRYSNRFFRNRRYVEAEFISAPGPMRWEHRTHV